MHCTFRRTTPNSKMLPLKFTKKKLLDVTIFLCYLHMTWKPGAMGERPMLNSEPILLKKKTSYQASLVSEPQINTFKKKI